MKDFIIKNLSIYDFKGQTRTFTPNEHKTFVKGANGVGKTTIYKAFCWLLTSYTDAINVKNHELYDSRVELTPSTPVARVVANVIVDDLDYKLERRAKAKFIRKRGSEEWVKDSSDSYTLLIDDVEVSTSDFNGWIDCHIGDSELLPYMLIGERFANLVIDDKKAARKILEHIVDGISISEMKHDYSDIEKDLKKYPIEQLLDRYKAQLKPLNQRLIAIDSLIIDKERELDEYKGLDFQLLEREIEEKTKEFNLLEEQINDSTKYFSNIIKEREDLIKEIHSLSSTLGDKRLEYNEKHGKELSKLRIAMSEIDVRNKEIEEDNKRATSKYKFYTDELQKAKDSYNSLANRRETLLKRRDEVKGMVFDSSVCPYCGQELPKDELEKERKKFNEKKEQDLQYVVKEGKSIKEQMDELVDKINFLQTIVDDGLQLKEFIDESKLRNEYDELMAKRIAFEETDEYKSITNHIDKLKESIPSTPSVDKDLREKKDKCLSELSNMIRESGRKSIKNKVEKDVGTLKLERRNLGSEIARIEGCIALVKAYDEERAAVISERINKKLSDCKIVMYSKQKDGTLKPDCVIVSNDGVKYATLNNSARISTCLSLQRLFCEYCEINMPIFIDESSVFDSRNLPSFDTQTIYLFANDSETLIVE